MGNIFVTVTVWDVFNTFDELLLNISVININDPPVILVFEAQDTLDRDELTFTIYEDVLFTAPIVVGDIDSDHMGFVDSQAILVIIPDPNDPFRAVATYTPTQSDIGQIITTLEVWDGDGGSDAINIVFNVVGTNDDPASPEVTQMGG